MKKLILLLALCFPLQLTAIEQNASDIKAVNQAVATLEKSKDTLYILEIKLHVSELEATPPDVKYYFNPETMKPVILQVDVGHEVFSTRHSYYFKNNKVIKYLKEQINHPDSPPKEAIIYNKDGAILWKNINEPAVSEKQVKELFANAMSAVKAFSAY
jgi:hypothetical protein